MAWDDPSPRARARPVAAASPSQPGYGNEPVSFGRLMFALLLAGVAGVSTALATRHGLMAWQGHVARASLLDLVLSVAFGFVVAVFAWRYLASRPGGGGWLLRLGRQRSWDDRYGDPTFGDIAAAEVVGDVIADAIDAAID